jgi:preprotein translocase SecE subunit
MAKKNVQPANEEVEVIAPDTVEATATKETTTKTKEVKNTKKESKSKEKVSAKQENDTKKKDNKNSKNNKNKKERKSMKKRATEIISELKKVSKPSFGKVVKNTCVVIVVVAICTLLLFGMDRLFSLIYDLLLP